MSDDPFSGLRDAPQDRKGREGRLRQQRWKSFRASLAAVTAVVVCAGLGGGLGGWAVERDATSAPDRFLGGVVYGLVGGFGAFLLSLYAITRQTLMNDTHGDKDDIDAGASLFWSAVGGAALAGCAGATCGLSGGAFRAEIAACAGGAVLLAVLAAARLRKVATQTQRSGTKHS